MIRELLDIFEMFSPLTARFHQLLLVVASKCETNAEAISSDIVPNLFSNTCNICAVLYVRDDVPQLSNHTCTRT